MALISCPRLGLLTAFRNVLGVLWFQRRSTKENFPHSVARPDARDRKQAISGNGRGTLWADTALSKCDFGRAGLRPSRGFAGAPMNACFGRIHAAQGPSGKGRYQSDSEPSIVAPCRPAIRP